MKPTHTIRPLGVILCAVPFLVVGTLLQAQVPEEPPSAEGEPTEETPVLRIDPEDADAMRARLATLGEVIDDIELRKFQNLIDIFLDASAGGRAAADLYLDCIHEIDFRQAGKREIEFREWRQAHDDTLYDQKFTKALQLQLKYLAITLRAARAEELETVFPLLVEHIEEITSLSAPPGAERFRARDGKPIQFRPSIGGSVFSRRYDLSFALSKLESWELDPFNIGGIYEATILPYLRSEDPGALLSAWRKRIEDEKRMAELREGKAEFDFLRLTLPELEWGMLKDEFQLSPSATTITRLLAHIDRHKATHPKAGSWVEEATSLLSPDKSAPVSEAEAAGPTVGK